MCLILFGWRTHTDFSLVLAANRDEFYERPTAVADFWEEYPEMLAGKDLKGGGTWLGITKQGRFAAITNYRNTFNEKKNAPTRGHLTTGFLQSSVSPETYIQKLQKTASEYNGFNLLLGDGDSLWYYNNIVNKGKPLSAGVYGLSNAFLDSDWPKVTEGKKELTKILSSNEPSEASLFDMLQDKKKAPDDLLPSTGVPYEWEKLLSSKFIISEKYGTSISSVLFISAGGKVSFAERTFARGSQSDTTQRFEFSLK